MQPRASHQDFCQVRVVSAPHSHGAPLRVDRPGGAFQLTTVVCGELGLNEVSVETSSRPALSKSSGQSSFTTDFAFCHTRQRFRCRPANSWTLSNADRLFGRRAHAWGGGPLGARWCRCRLSMRCKTSYELSVLIVDRRLRCTNRRRTSCGNKLDKPARLRVARRGNCWHE